jgi:ATP-dependent Clp protease adaptor protein ClpS
MQVETSPLIQRILSGAATQAPEVVTAPPVTTPVDQEKQAKPPMYAVILHNDNTTGPDFVTRVLMEAFSVEGVRARNIMMTAHRSGSAVVQVTVKEVAETRVANAEAIIRTAQQGVDFVYARACELRFTVEEESKGGE